jgi:hypothetical protein
MGRRGSRSRSRSISPERKSNARRHIAAGVLGATAAGAAHHQYKNHQQERPRPVLRKSYSAESFRGPRRSSSIFHRNRSPSPKGPGKIRTGLAAVAAATIAKKAMDHYRESRARSPSPSSSHHRQRSRSRSTGIPKKAVAATMIGAAIAGRKLQKSHKEHEEERRQEARSRRNSEVHGPYGPNVPY